MPEKEPDLNENTTEKYIRFRHQDLVFKLFGKAQLDIAYLYSTKIKPLHLALTDSRQRPVSLCVKYLYILV